MKKLLRQHLGQPHALGARFRAVRARTGSIRMSQYDIARTCNLTCEGCLFFLGQDYEPHAEAKDADVIENFFAAEAARGVNFGQFAGAEPALRQDILRLAARHIPRGVVFTNGTVRIDPSLPYALHISVWGLGEEGARLRGADVLSKALRNYRSDPRATFVFTINAGNIDTIPDVAQLCADEGVRLSFGHFSPTTEYLERLAGDDATGNDYFRISSERDNLILDAEALVRTEAAIEAAMDAHPQTIVYSRAFNR